MTRCSFELMSLYSCLSRRIRISSPNRPIIEPGANFEFFLTSLARRSADFQRFHEISADFVGGMAQTWRFAWFCLPSVPCNFSYFSLFFPYFLLHFLVFFLIFSYLGPMGPHGGGLGPRIFSREPRPPELAQKKPGPAPSKKK